MRRVQRSFQQGLSQRLPMIQLMVMLGSGGAKGLGMVDHVQLAGENECRSQQKSRGQQADEQDRVTSRKVAESSQHVQRLADSFWVILLPRGLLPAASLQHPAALLDLAYPCFVQ